MIEAWGLEDYLLPTLLLIAGAALGLVFGVAAQISRFCLRRAVAGAPEERASAGGVWAAALLSAIIGAQLLSAGGYVAFDETRFTAASLPLGAILIGGLMFGVGMVLTRGCASRLVVLGASGNLRALIVLLVFAAFAYATLRGVFAPSAAWLREAGAVEAGGGLPALFGLGAYALWFAGAIAIGLAVIVARSGARLQDIALGAVIGLAIVAGWAATGFVLFDEFDPRPADSLAFTSGGADALFYFMASTALEPSFGVGVVAGALVGAHLSARLRGELALESFSAP
ncbi:MAG: YeeE/YedE thiosulfate transporter family protein, partial [Pseudomonadota bacterium]